MTRQIPLVAFTESRLYPLLTQSDNKLKQLRKNIRNWDANIPYGLLFCVYNSSGKSMVLEPSLIPEDAVDRYTPLWRQGTALKTLLPNLSDASCVDDNPYILQFGEIIEDVQDPSVALWRIYEVLTALQLERTIAELFEDGALVELTAAIIAFYKDDNPLGYCLGACFEAQDNSNIPLVTSVTNIPLK